MSLDNDSMRRDNVALDRGLREIELARDYIQKASNSISAAKSSLDPKITIRAFSSAKQKAEMSLRNSRDIITRCNNYIEDTKRQIAYVNNACEEVVSELGNDTKDDKPSLMINPFTNQAMERPKVEDQVGPINQDLYDHPEKYLEQIEKRKAKDELKQQLKAAGYNSTDIERITQGEIDNTILQQRMNEINNEIFKEYCNGDSTRYQALVEAAIVNNMYFNREESLQRKGKIEATISQIEAIKAKAKAEVANYKRIIDGAKFDSKTKMHVYKDTSGVTREFDNESFDVLKGMYESAVAVEVACDASYDEQTKTLNAELKEINEDLSDPSKKDFKYKSVEEINARIKEIESQAQSAALEAEKKELLEIKNTIAGNVAVILAKYSLDTDKTRDITSYKNPWRLLEIGDNYTFMDSDEFRGALLARMLNGDATIMPDFQGHALNVCGKNGQEFYFYGDARQLTFNEYQEWINASTGKKENEPTVISQEEIKIFNYICNTEGYDAGYKYLKGKEAEFDQRNIAIKHAADVKFGPSNTWAGSLSIFTAIPEAMLSVGRIRVRKASGQNLHYYDSYSTSNTWNSTISGDLHKKSNILGYAYDTLYSADRLMLSALTTYATGGSGTLPSLATNAVMYGVPTFTSTVYNSKINNIADDKAIAYALTCATARTLATSYTLTKATGLESTFNNMLTNGGLMSKISSIVKNSSVLSRNPEFSKNLLLTGYCMVSQGTVSGTTAVVDRTLTSLADAMINGDKSDLYIKYSNYMNTHDCSPFEGYMYVAGDNLAGSFSTFASAFGPGALLGGMKANMIINHQKNIQQNINFKEAFENYVKDSKEDFGSSGNNPGGGPNGGSSGGYSGSNPNGGPSGGPTVKSSDSLDSNIKISTPNGPKEYDMSDQNKFLDEYIHDMKPGDRIVFIDKILENADELHLSEETINNLDSWRYEASVANSAPSASYAQMVAYGTPAMNVSESSASGHSEGHVEMAIGENGEVVQNYVEVFVPDSTGEVIGSIQQLPSQNQPAIADSTTVTVPVTATVDGIPVDSFAVINENGNGVNATLPFAPTFNNSNQTLPDISIADWCKLTGAFNKNQLSFMKNLDKIKMKVANNDNKISLDDFNYLLGQSSLSLSLKDKIKKDFEKNGLITGVSNDITQNEIDNTNEDIINESNTVADSTWEVEDDWDDDLSFNIKNIDAETFRYTDYTNVANKLKQKLGQNERLIYDKFTQKFHIVNSETNTEFEVTPAFLRNDDILHITNGLISDKNNGIPRVTIDKVKGADNLILVRSTSVLPIENLVTTPQHGGAPSRGDGAYRGINSSTANRATIHWAFNGFVDGGFFGASDWNSNPFVILEPYKYHIYDSCVGGFSGDVSFDQDMRLSDEAIILINKNWHDEHANEIPEGLNYRVFDGDPSKCVENVLSEMGYYSNDAPSDITGQNKLQQEFEDIVTEVLKENDAKNVRIRPFGGIYDQYNRDMNRIQAILECNRHQNVRIGKDVTPISNEEFLAIIDNKDALLDVDTGKIDISKYNTNLGDYGRSPKEGLAAIMQRNGIRYNQENGEFYIETYDGWIGSQYGQTSLSNGEIDAAYEKLNSILNVSNSTSTNNTTVEFSNDIETALKEMTEHFGDPGSVVNSLLINSGKNATEILETLSGQEKADFEKYLNDTESGKWLKTLTADEIDAINLRTLSSGNIFNLEKNGNANPRMQKVLNDIDSAIKKYGGLKDDIKLYRGVYSTGFIDQFKDNIVVEAFKNVDTNNPNEILNALKSLEGKSLSTAVNMATSPGYHQASAASPIIMEITAKKGVDGAYINALSSKYNVENELLLGRNQNLVIKNVEVRDGKIHVICEMSTTNSENEISSVSDLQVIDVSKINTKAFEVGQFYRGVNDNVVNMSYEGYNFVYKTDNDFNSAVKQIKVENRQGKILLELNNTIGITVDGLSQLPDNVEVRITGDYGLENFKGFKNTNAGLASFKNATYSVSELKEIMNIITKFESGIDPTWDDVTKAKYAFDFLQDKNNIVYNANPPRNSIRGKQFDGLAGLLEKESTCQGYSHIYRELLTRMGIECTEISGKMIGGHSQHAFNVVKLNGKNIIVDTVRPNFKNITGPSFGVEDIDVYYFNSNKDLVPTITTLKDVLGNSSDDTDSDLIVKHDFRGFSVEYSLNEILQFIKDDKLESQKFYDYLKSKGRLSDSVSEGVFFAEMVDAIDGRTLNTGTPVDSDHIEDKKQAARAFSEGNASLEKLLLNLWSRGIETIGCCGGHKDDETQRPYISMVIDQNSMKTLEVLFNYLILGKDLDVAVNLMDDGRFNVIVLDKKHTSDTPMYEEMSSILNNPDCVEANDSYPINIFNDIYNLIHCADITSGLFSFTINGNHYGRYNVDIRIKKFDEDEFKKFCYSKGYHLNETKHRLTFNVGSLVEIDNIIANLTKFANDSKTPSVKSRVLKSVYQFIKNMGLKRATNESPILVDLEKTNVEEESIPTDDFEEINPGIATPNDNINEDFKANYGELADLVDKYGNVPEFVSGLNKLSSEEEKKSYIKKFTDDILSNTVREYNDSRPPIVLTNSEYNEIFKYSSFREYFEKADKYDLFGGYHFYENLESLPNDYIANMSIPFSELLDWRVAKFIVYFGLQNVVEFNDECGNFFAKNNCEMLRLMFDMYLHYASNESDFRRNIYVGKDGDSITLGECTKDQFYEAMRRMIVYGPTDSDYVSRAPDYRNMTGEFKKRYAELFISEEAPEELQKLFYTKSITPQILIQHPEYISYLEGKDLKSCFKYRDIKVDKKWENLYEFLGSKTDFNSALNFIMEYNDILDVILNNDLTHSYTFETIFSQNDNFDQIKNAMCELWRRVIIEQGIAYPDNVPNEIKEKYPMMFLDENAPQELQEAFKNRTVTLELILSNPAYRNYLNGVDLECLFKYMPIMSYESDSNITRSSSMKSVNLAIAFQNTLGNQDALDTMLAYSKYINKAYASNKFNSFKYHTNDTPDEFLNNIDNVVLNCIVDGIMKYDENMPSHFKNNNPTLFLNSNVSQELKDKFYNREFTLEDFDNNPELFDLFENTNIACGFSEDISWIIPLFNDDGMKQANQNRMEVISEYYKIDDAVLREEFKNYVVEYGTNIELEKIQYISEVISRLSLSNSSEMFAFRRLLTKQILKSDNPIESLKKIEDVFIKNSIPIVGKIYSCFEILHPNFLGFNFENSTISPSLKKSSTTEKKFIVFSDLIKSAFGSNNKSVNSYLKNIEIGCNLYENIKNGKVQLDSLNEDEIKELEDFRNHIATLYNNSTMAKRENSLYTSTGDILKDIEELSKRISPDGTLDYNIADRVINMFCGFTGINTLEQAKQYIDNKIKTADLKNREAANSDMKLEQGDLIKGILDFSYLSNILQNGSVSKEFLGANAGSDNTPLDTDVSMITSTKESISEMIEDTQAADYGPIWLVLKNDDRFSITKTEAETPDFKRDMSKLELFYTGYLGKGHYGIRTGFASSEIDYIVMDNYDPRVGLEIVMNGFYIPVANKEGKIVFTPKDYDELRNKMSGLSYFGEDSYKFSENLVTKETYDIASQIEQSNAEVKAKRDKINNVIKSSLEELGLHLKTSIDGDLTEGFVELIDTGSTGRGTNKPGDGDFDFMMRLDRTILSSSSKLKELKEALLKRLGKEHSGEVTGSGDFRLKNVKIDSDTVVDIDITFTAKTDKVTYSTDMALQDRLSTIQKNDPEKYKYVVANILLAKQVLKKAEAYKPNRGEVPQGGLGGVGIENWILQNGGSFIDAARNFVKVAEGKNFLEFRDSYRLWDFGENHLAEKKGFYPHDNFVVNNMSAAGYQKMVQALKEFLEKVDSEEPLDINKMHTEISGIEQALDKGLKESVEFPLDNTSRASIINTIKSLDLSAIDEITMNKYCTDEGFDYGTFLKEALLANKLLPEDVEKLGQLKDIQDILDNPVGQLNNISYILNTMVNEITDNDISVLDKTSYNYLSFLAHYVAKNADFRIDNYDNMFKISRKLAFIAQKMRNVNKNSTIKFNGVNVVTYGSDVNFLKNMLTRVLNLIEKLPQEFQKLYRELASVEIYDSDSPYDLYHLIQNDKMRSDPNVHTFISDASYNFLNNKMSIDKSSGYLDDAKLISILAHELGHALDNFCITKYGTSYVEKGILWKESMDADGYSISHYGETGIDEDFAEMCKLYAQALLGYVSIDYVNKYYPNRLKILKCLLDINSYDIKNPSGLSYQRKLEILGILDKDLRQDTSVFATLLGENTIEICLNLSPNDKIRFTQLMFEKGINNQYFRVFYDASVGNKFLDGFNSEQLFKLYDVCSSNVDTQNGILLRIFSAIARKIDYDNVYAEITKLRTKNINEKKLILELKKYCCNSSAWGTMNLTSIFYNRQSNVSKELYEKILKIFFDNVK